MSGVAHSRVMGVLGRRGLASGAYADETPCSMEWLQMETESVLAAVAAGKDPALTLIDSNWWPEDWGPFPDEIRAELLAACGT